MEEVQGLEVIPRFCSDCSSELEYIVCLCQPQVPEPSKALCVLDLRSGLMSVVRNLDYWPMASRFSPDDRWIALHFVLPPGDRRQIFIVPFRNGTPGDLSDWRAVTDGSGSDARPAWSPDGNLLYFLSDRDGSNCIWAQPLDSATKRPAGAAFGVLHLHQARNRVFNSGAFRLAVAQDKIVFSMPELTGNIWMMKTSKE